MMAPDFVAVARVTGRCNLACKFCAYSKEMPVGRRDAAAPELERFGLALADLARSRGEQAHLSWLGGEPLLWRPLLALADRLAGCRDALSLGLTTNGTPLEHKRMRDHVGARYALVTVSVDGLAAWNDRCRNEPGLFARVERAISALAAEAPHVAIRANTILMRQSVRDLEALATTLARWGVRELTFNQLGGYDRPDFFPAHRLSADDVVWLRAELPGIRARAAGLGLRILGSLAYEERLSASAADAAVAVDDCGPGTRFIFVDEDGIASPCSFTGPQYGTPLSELGTAEALAALPSRWQAARAEKRAVACDNCLSTQVFGKFPAAVAPAL